MGLEFVTSQRGGKPHVKSHHVAMLNAAIIGMGTYVMTGLGNELHAYMATSNTLHAESGLVIADGREVIVDDGGCDWTIQTGTLGQRRIDVACLKYTKANGPNEPMQGLEDIEPHTVKGDPTTGQPVAPTIPSCNLADGATIEGLVPLFEVELQGTQPVEVRPLYATCHAYSPRNHDHDAASITSGALPIAYGGTGSSDAANARKNLGITPASVGALAGILTNGYWGMADPNKSDGGWLRTPSPGILPYKQGGASSLGTSSWPFDGAYLNNVYAKAFRLGGNLMSDVIVAQGKSGNWNYVKLANGIAWCEGTWAHQYDAPRGWGSIFYNAWEKGAYAYPFKFVGVPTAWLDIESPNGSMWLGKMTSGTDSLSPKAYIIAGTSQGQINVRLNVRAMGRWK